jgi:hypothetical protein
MKLIPTTGDIVFIISIVVMAITFKLMNKGNNNVTNKQR